MVREGRPAAAHSSAPLAMTGGQVVQHRHVPAATCQPRHHVAADVAGTSTDENRLHGLFPGRVTTTWIGCDLTPHSVGIGGDRQENRAQREVFVYRPVTPPWQRAHQHWSSPIRKNVTWTRTPILQPRSSAIAESATVGDAPGAELGNAAGGSVSAAPGQANSIRARSSISRSSSTAIFAGILSGSARSRSSPDSPKTIASRTSRSRWRPVLPTPPFRGCRLRSRNRTSSGSCRFCLPRWSASRISAQRYWR